MRRILLFLVLITVAVPPSSAFVLGTGSVHVHVRTPEGRPWHGVGVGISSPSGLVVPSLTYTDPAGVAVFPVLCPGDDYEIRVYTGDQRPLVLDGVTARREGPSVLLINPYALLPNIPVNLKSDLGTLTRERRSRGEVPWIEWSGARDPLTGAYHYALIPKRLFCPDGIHLIVNPLDRETQSWLRWGFAMRHRPDPADPVPQPNRGHPLVAEIPRPD